MAGMTTRIGYGIVLGPSEEIDDDNPIYDLTQDAEEWWLKTNNYQPIPNVYTPEGNRLPGVTEEEISAYFSHKHEFAASNPCPVSVDYHFNWDYPTYVLYLESSVIEAYDDPLVLQSLPSISDDDKQLFKNFLTKHNILFEKEPAWIVAAIYDN